MILRALREDLSADAVKAVLSIQGIPNPLPHAQQLVITAECLVGFLKELGLPCQDTPERQAECATVLGKVQSLGRREIEALRFEKSH